MTGRRRARTGVAALVALLAGCGEAPVAVDPACRVVAVAAAPAGPAVAGAEDAVARPDAVYVSAYDRLGGDPPPEGALHRVPIDGLRKGGPVVAPALRPDPPAAGGFRPHGFDLLADRGQTLAAVVNRRVRPAGQGQGERATTIDIYRVEADRLVLDRSLADPALCAANDVAFLDRDTLFVTIDRARCGGFGWRDALGIADGRLLRIDLDAGATIAPVADGIAFANGLAVDRARGRLHVAATRGRAVLAFDLATAADGPARAVATHPVPGAPDNLTVLADGTVLLALHPSLVGLAAYRYDWFGRDHAPSRLARLAPDGAVTVLHDDPDGALLSAATVAIATPDGDLLAGSVRDAGLLLCPGGIGP